MNLYVVRHAIAVERGTPGFEDDSQRPVTEQGRQKMIGITRGLKQLKTELQAIVSSPYVRARQTAEILAEGLDFKLGSIELSDALQPMVDPAELLKEIRSKHQVANLAVVGHEPHLSSFISFLLMGNIEMSINLKKGGVCLVTVAMSPRGSEATLEWLMTPKQLIGLAG